MSIIYSFRVEMKIFLSVLFISFVLTKETLAQGDFRYKTRSGLNFIKQAFEGAGDMFRAYR